MFNALACRSEKQSIFTIGFFSNKMFNISVGGSILAQLFVIYVPFFQSIFQTEALSLYDLCKIVLVTSTVFWADELKKIIRKKGLGIGRSSSGYRIVQQNSGGNGGEIENAIDLV
jgi:Ca2+-transporting ATPase